MPLLPGDSLLFAAGALAASQGGINIAILIPNVVDFSFFEFEGNNVTHGGVGTEGGGGGHKEGGEEGEETHGKRVRTFLGMGNR